MKKILTAFVVIAVLMAVLVLVPPPSKATAAKPVATTPDPQSQKFTNSPIEAPKNADGFLSITNLDWFTDKDGSIKICKDGITHWLPITNQEQCETPLVTLKTYFKDTPHMQYEGWAVANGNYIILYYSVNVGNSAKN